MRKDYIEASPGQDEIGFVESFWTSKWMDEKGSFDKINLAGTDEFKAISPFLETLPKGSAVLDAGCGTGAWVQFLTAMDFRATGIDISQATIDALNRLFPEAVFLRRDIRDTALAANSFDAIISWGVIEHFEIGLKPCLDELFRLLKPGGLLFASVPFDNLRMALRGLAFKLQVPPPVGAASRFYQWRLTRGEFRDELQMAGFIPDSFHLCGKHVGIRRALHHDLGLPKDSPWIARLSRPLNRLLPASWISHMVLGVARKPNE